MNGGGTIVNSGTIEGTSLGVGGNNILSITNSGTISGGHIGIQITGTPGTSTITNSGTITSGSYGIYLQGTGRGANIVSSGTISAPTAIQLTTIAGGSADTLTLLPGSMIIGAINLGGGGDTINFRVGNQNLTFDTLAGATITSTVPYAVSGTQVATIDPTGFAAGTPMLKDLTGGIAGALDDRLDGPRDGLWGDAFAGFGRTQASGTSDGFDRSFGGMLLGYDTPLNDQTLAGIFGGLGRTGMRTDSSSSSLDSTSGFVGAYVHTDQGPLIIDAALTGGVMANSGSRTINNNTVAGGIETASADYNGAFISPSLGIGLRQEVGNLVVTPNVKLRYGGLYLGSYSETGSTANLSVGARTVQYASARAELKLALEHQSAGGGSFDFGGKVGVEEFVSWGNDVEASLLGSNISFASTSNGSTPGAYAGLDAHYTRPSGFNAFASIQMNVHANKDWGTQFRAGFDAPF